MWRKLIANYKLMLSLVVPQGSYTAGTKKKRRKESDFKTLGEGYDETDPFIDNSDAVSVVKAETMFTYSHGKK